MLHGIIRKRPEIEVAELTIALGDGTDTLGESKREALERVRGRE